MLQILAQFSHSSPQTFVDDFSILLPEPCVQYPFIHCIAQRRILWWIYTDCTAQRALSPNESLPKNAGLPMMRISE